MTGALARFSASVTAERTEGRVRRVHWVNQVHGASVAGETSTHSGPVGSVPGPDAATWSVCLGSGDGLVANSPEVAVAVLTADCCSIALASPEGVFGAAHAGWRGLVAGVLGETAKAMRALGASDLTAALGPCIHPECYEFSPVDLDEVAAVLGDGVRAETSDGRPALDLPAAVSAALSADNVEQLPGVDACTACDPGYFSHRARRDPERQALVVWSETASGSR